MIIISCVKQKKLTSWPASWERMRVTSWPPSPPTMSSRVRLLYESVSPPWWTAATSPLPGRSNASNNVFRHSVESFFHPFFPSSFPLFKSSRVCVCVCSGSDKKESLVCELFCRIASDFPGDVGCWSVYFLNFVTLEEGQSLFLGPNVPHAYISGGMYIIWYLHFAPLLSFPFSWLKAWGYHPPFVSVCESE